MNSSPLARIKVQAPPRFFSSWSLEKTWTTGGFGIVLLLLGVVSLISYQNAARLRQSAAQMKQTHTVLQTLANVSTTLTEAESQRWQYLLFQDPDALGRFEQAVVSVEPQLSRLRSPLEDTPLQRQRLDSLESLVDRQMGLLEQSIQRFGQDPSTLAPTDPLIAEGKRNQDAIRRTIAQLQSEEEQLLQQQLDESQEGHRIRMGIEILGTLLTFAVLLWVYSLLYRQLIKRQTAEAQQWALAQAKELGELKLQFFSMISHEFRTPLSLIMGSAQLLEESIKPVVEEKRLKNLYRIQTSARLMTQLLNDILTLARAEAGRLECNPSLVEVQSFCLNLVEDVQLSYESQHSIKFIQRGSQTHAWVDEKLLYSIISNLLSNAIKYSPSDKDIHVVLNCEADQIIFQVKDEGIGIPSEELPRLYDPFSRGRSASGIAGTGLGLAVVKKCLDLHQGTIAVESEVGVGTTFTVTILTKQPY
ncbi:MAG TPA: ATP-binding protein [Trichocoleus sp.]